VAPEPAPAAPVSRPAPAIGAHMLEIVERPVRKPKLEAPPAVKAAVQTRAAAPAAPSKAAPAKTGPKHKVRGSHAMVDNEGDEGQGSRFVAGQLHLSESDRARRSAGKGKKTKTRVAEPS